MLRLALAQLRRHGWRYLALFFAVFAAVAITVATAAITQSLQATVNGLFDKPYAGVGSVAQVRSSDKEAVDRLLANIPGDYAFDQQVSGSIKQDGNLFETTTIRAVQAGTLQWRTIKEGKLPENPGEVAVVDGTPLGTVLELKTPGNKELKSVTVVGRLEQSAQEELTGSRSVLADAATVNSWSGNSVQGELRTAQHLTKNQLDATVASELNTASKQAQVLSDKYMSRRNHYFLLLTAFMFIVGVVAILVIYSSYSVIAAERRREFALLKAVGASACQLRMSALFEASILSVLAGLLGIPAGLASAQFAGNHAMDFGVRVPLTVVSLDPQWLCLIFVSGIAVSIVSAIPAVSGSVRAPIVESLASSAPRSNKWAISTALLLGSGLLAGGAYGMTLVDQLPMRRALILAITSAGTVVLGVLTLAAVILPWIIFQLSRLVAAIPTLNLGMAFVGRQRLRAGSLVAIALAGVALVSAVLAGQQQLEESILSKATNKGAIDATVRALDGTASDSLIDALKLTPGVSTVSTPAVVPVEVANGIRDSVLVLSSKEGAELLRGGSTGAAPGELVLGTKSPLRNAYSDGTKATVTALRTEHSVTVRFSDGLETFIDPAILDGAPTTMLPHPVVLLKVEDKNVIPTLRSVSAAGEEEVTFQDSFKARDDVADSANRVLTMSTLLSLSALLIAFVGAFNTVSLMIRERNKDLRLLATIGVTLPRRVVILGIELFLLVMPTLCSGWLLGSYLGNWVAGVLV